MANKGVSLTKQLRPPALLAAWQREPWRRASHYGFLEAQRKEAASSHHHTVLCPVVQVALEPQHSCRQRLLAQAVKQHTRGGAQPAPARSKGQTR